MDRELKIFAGLVTFNPDISRLRENISAIEGAVASIIVFDNCSKNVEDIRQLLAEVPAASMIESRKNFGIATALNGIVAAAAERGADWVLLLDQDSVCRPGLPSILAEHASGDVAIICPDVVDRNLPSRMETNSSALSDVEACISSGSLTSIAAWSEVGGYDQSFFIDYVDFDFCLRLRMAGYRIVRDTRASLLHELGNSKKYWKFTSYNYSEFRLYHMSRDMIYYSVKHRAIKASSKMNGRGLFGNVLVLFKKIVVILCVEKQRSRKAWAVLRGTVSGLLAAAASDNGVNSQ